MAQLKSVNATLMGACERLAQQCRILPLTTMIKEPGRLKEDLQRAREEHDELQAKYKKVKKYYFERENEMTPLKKVNATLMDVCERLAGRCWILPWTSNMEESFRQGKHDGGTISDNRDRAIQVRGQRLARRDRSQATRVKGLPQQSNPCWRLPQYQARCNLISPVRGQMR
jgi:hypothetical protein